MGRIKIKWDFEVKLIPVIVVLLLIASLTANAVFVIREQNQGKITAKICGMYNDAADFSNYCLQGIGEAGRLMLLECKYPYTFTDKTHK